MSLNGTISKSVGSGYKLSIEWSATQSIANNTSTITAKLYWQSTSSAYYVNSSKSRTATITINGDTDTYSASAQLSGGQKKLLGTKVYTTGHSSDGTKICGIGGTFDISGISLSGTDYGTVSLSDTVTLNTIPRSSTLSSSLDWRPPNAFPISINRASSNFTHTVELFVKRKSSSTWTKINTWTNVGTSNGGGFATDDIKLAFTTLATDSSGDTRVILKTYNGSTLIGAHDYGVDSGYSGGEAVVEYSSKLDATNNANWNIGDSKHIDIARNHPSYTHVAKFYVNGQWIHTSPTVEYSYDWNPTQSEIDTMYAQTKNASSEDTTIELYTYYNGVQVDKVKNAYGTAKVVNSNPTFGTGYTYADTNATTKGITGNDQYIIQNNSTVVVTLPTSANATAINGATMSSYTATLNGVSINKNYSSTTALTFDFGKVNVGSNATLSVKAIDSRGLSTTTTKTITVIPWTAPSVNATVKRANGFETTTTVTLNGSFSALNVNGTNKNTIVSMSYRYKENTPTATFPSAFTNLTFTAPTGTTYTATNAVIELDNTKGYVFEVRTTDKLGSNTVTKTVVVGQPILFIDTDKNSVGVNKFPSNSKSLEIDGDIYATKGIHALNPTNGTAEAFLGWKDNIARIRVGGTSTGSVNGFQVQGTGDKVLLGLNNTDSLTVESGAIKLNGTSIYDYEVPKTTPSFLNGWTSYFDCAYWKTRDGMVFIMGMIRDGADGTVAFTLPVGCRPVSNQLFYAHTRGGGSHRIDVNTDGTVYVNTGDSAFNLWYDLNGFVFTTK